MKDDLENMIFDLFEDHVQKVFSNDNCKIYIYIYVCVCVCRFLSIMRLKTNLYILIDVMDIYIERQRRKVWIVDFNPFTPSTDGLLFEWSELAQCKFSSRY